MATTTNQRGHAPDVVWLDDANTGRPADFSIGDLAREYGISLRTLRF